MCELLLVCHRTVTPHLLVVCANAAVEVKWEELLTFLLWFSLISIELHGRKNSQTLKKCLNNFLLLSTPALNFTRNSRCNKWPIMNVNMWIYDVGCSLPVRSICAVRAAVGFFFFWGQTKTSSSDSLRQTRHWALLSTYNLVCVAPCWNEVSHCSGGTRARTHSRQILISGEQQSYFKHHSSRVSSQQVSCATRTVRSAEQCCGRLRRRHWHLGIAAIAVIFE